MIPALIVIICTEGYHCNRSEREIFPMPSWEVCIEAAKSVNHSSVPVESDNYKQEFLVTAFCGSVAE